MFAINDKRCYFSNAITSLPLSHTNLKKLVEFKEKFRQRIKRYFGDEKRNVFATENKAQELNERLFYIGKFLQAKRSGFY